MKLGPPRYADLSKDALADACEQIRDTFGSSARLIEADITAMLINLDQAALATIGHLDSAAGMREENLEAASSRERSALDSSSRLNSSPLIRNPPEQWRFRAAGAPAPLIRHSCKSGNPQVAQEVRVCGGVLLCRYHSPGCGINRKSTYFRSGAEGIRTPDLRRAKAKKCILARTGASRDSACLQVFYRIVGGGSSIAYQPILARLQYGCSKSIGVDMAGGLLIRSLNPPVIVRTGASVDYGVSRCFL